jgi:phosphatidylglycerophosphatase A
MITLMSNKTPSFKQLLSHPVHLLAFGFGSGLSTKAPGTMGTLVAIPVYYLLVFFPDFYLPVLLLVITAGCWICGKTAKEIGVHDHGGIVWDEIAGYLVTMYWASFSWQNVIVGFMLFRLLDIAKPWPISWLDRKVKGGVGIMADDLAAGLMSAACLYAINLVV